MSAFRSPKIRMKSRSQSGAISIGEHLCEREKVTVTKIGHTW